MSLIEPSKSQYVQIADLLRGRIADGTYAKNAALPSEPELAAELNTSRVTVNKAVGLLRANGDVKVKRGLGTFVRSIDKIPRHARQRFAARNRGTGAGEVEVRSQGMTSTTEYTFIGPVVPPATVARALGIGAGEEALVRKRALFADGEPTQLADSYFPMDLVKGSVLTQEQLGQGGSYARLTDLGYGPVRFTETVNGRTPDEIEQRKLDLEPTQAVFEIFHQGYAADDRVINVTIHVMPCHLWTLHYDWRDGDDAS